MHVLIAGQVERALKCWISGVYCSTKKAFSGDNYASRIEVYMRMISGMKEQQWGKVLRDCARVVAQISEEKRINGLLAHEDQYSNGDESDVSEMMDPADLAALDADSEGDD